MANTMPPGSIEADRDLIFKQLEKKVPVVIRPDNKMLELDVLFEKNGKNHPAQDVANALGATQGFARVEEVKTGEHKGKFKVIIIQPGNITQGMIGQAKGAICAAKRTENFRTELLGGLKKDIEPRIQSYITDNFPGTQHEITDDKVTILSPIENAEQREEMVKEFNKRGGQKALSFEEKDGQFFPVIDLNRYAKIGLNDRNTLFISLMEGYNEQKEKIKARNTAKTGLESALKKGAGGLLDDITVSEYPGHPAGVILETKIEKPENAGFVADELRQERETSSGPAEGDYTVTVLPPNKDGYHFIAIEDITATPGIGKKIEPARKQLVTVLAQEQGTRDDVHTKMTGGLAGILQEEVVVDSADAVGKAYHTEKAYDAAVATNIAFILNQRLSSGKSQTESFARVELVEGDKTQAHIHFFPKNMIKDLGEITNNDIKVLDAEHTKQQTAAADRAKRNSALRQDVEKTLKAANDAWGNAKALIHSQLVVVNPATTSLPDPFSPVTQSGVNLREIANLAIRVAQSNNLTVTSEEKTRLFREIDAANQTKLAIEGAIAAAQTAEEAAKKAHETAAAVDLPGGGKLIEGAFRGGGVNPIQKEAEKEKEELEKFVSFHAIQAYANKKAGVLKAVLDADEAWTKAKAMLDSADSQEVRQHLANIADGGSDGMRAQSIIGASLAPLQTVNAQLTGQLKLAESAEALANDAAKNIGFESADKLREALKKEGALKAKKIFKDTDATKEGSYAEFTNLIAQATAASAPPPQPTPPPPGASAGNGGIITALAALAGMIGLPMIFGGGEGAGTGSMLLTGLLGAVVAGGAAMLMTGFDPKEHLPGVAPAAGAGTGPAQAPAAAPPTPSVSVPNPGPIPAPGTGVAVRK